MTGEFGINGFKVAKGSVIFIPESVLGPLVLLLLLLIFRFDDFIDVEVELGLEWTGTLRICPEGGGGSVGTKECEAEFGGDLIDEKLSFCGVFTTFAILIILSKSRKSDTSPVSLLTMR